MGWFFLFLPAAAAIRTTRARVRARLSPRCLPSLDLQWLSHYLLHFLSSRYSCAVVDISSTVFVGWRHVSTHIHTYTHTTYIHIYALLPPLVLAADRTRREWEGPCKGGGALPYTHKNKRTHTHTHTHAPMRYQLSADIGWTFVDYLLIRDTWVHTHINACIHTYIHTYMGFAARGGEGYFMTHKGTCLCSCMCR